MIDPAQSIPSDEPVSDQALAPMPVAPLSICADMLAPPQTIEKRIDFERGMHYWPPLTLVLIAACVAVFVWELTSGALSSKDAIIDAGALSRAEVMKGEIWRVVTSMFLHGGFDHLIGNCFVLYVLGMATEHAFGISRAGLIYLVSGLSGSALSVAMTQGPSVGASGAIFGLCGSVIVFLFRYHKVFFVRDKRISVVLLVWAVWTVATGFLSPEIDNFCHIGGFVGGVLAAAVLPRRDRPDLQTAFNVVFKPA
jgi:rhomboid protease GluP